MKVIKLIEKEIKYLSEIYFPVIVLSDTNNGIKFESNNAANKLFLNCVFYKEKGIRTFNYNVQKKLSMISQFYEKYYHNRFSGFVQQPKRIATFSISNQLTSYNYKHFDLVESNLKAYKFEFKDNISEIGKLVSLLHEDLQNCILPSFEKMYNVHTLNKAINNPIDFHVKQNIQSFMCGNHHYDKMIVARLAGDPNFEEICQFIFSFFEKIITGPSAIRSKECLKYLTVAYDIYEQLKSVEPLKDPNLNNCEIHYEMEPVYFDDEGSILS